MCGTSWDPFCHVCLFAVEERRIFSPIRAFFRDPFGIDIALT